MRNKNILFSFEEIAILLQYLYIDEANTILVNNGLCDLQIRMDDYCHFWCKNMNFPDHETSYDDEMTVYMFQQIIQYCKEAPPVQFPNHFNNRWEEIKNIASMNLALNLSRQQ